MTDARSSKLVALAVVATLLFTNASAFSFDVWKGVEEQEKIVNETVEFALDVVSEEMEELYFDHSAQLLGYDEAFKDGYKQGYRMGYERAYREGLREGNVTGYETGYKKGVESGREAVLNKINYSTAKLEGGNIIDMTGTFEIDGYEIFLQKSYNNDHLDGSPLGYTYKNGEIWLQSNISPKAFFTNCQHEVLHNKYPDNSHKWIYRESTNRVIGECVKLMTYVELGETPYNPRGGVVTD